MPNQFTSPSGWTVSSVRNPWGQVPHTAGGQSLTDSARKLADRLHDRPNAENMKNVRRHHYVPQGYLRRWSFDNRRVWTLDTVAGKFSAIGVKDLCVEENFHRVVGPDGNPHNAVETMFTSVDEELCRVQKMFDQLREPDSLTLDDYQILCVVIAAQRIRTKQQRRVHSQYAEWLAAQAPSMKSWFDLDDPLFASGIHTEGVFRALWSAADVLLGRQIEIWEDPSARFPTCDAPVLVPFIKGRRPPLLSAHQIIWPLSPNRVVVLSNDLVGEKAVIRQASSKQVGTVRDAVLQGRERMVVAGVTQREQLARYRLYGGRRVQVELRCSERTPQGERVAAGGCCVRFREWFGIKPDAALCSRGLHQPAPEMLKWT